MSRATNHLENHALNALFNKQAFPSVTNMFLGLFKDNPSDTGALTSEFSNASNYARITLSVLMNSSSDVGGTIDNATEIIFNIASNTWGTISWLGVLDTSTLTTGVMYLYTSLVAGPVHIDTGEQFRIAAGDLVFTCA